MATHTIEITAMAFPADTPVAKGDTVVWTNRMNMNHTVTADNGEFDSGVLGKDKSFSHVFAAAGSVPYHCDIHPNMEGKVTVAAGAPAAVAATHKIEITAMAFPADTPVATGDTVVWTNRMNMNHTVTADNGEFDSGVLGKDKSFSHVFAAAGAVPYHCDIHPNMQGSVTVAAGAGAGTTPTAATHKIDITAMAFPANTPVAKGDTVVWTNRMNMNHTVTADNGEFDSGPLAKDKSFSHVFAAAGTVLYHCDIHPEMEGKVTVAVGPPVTHKIEITTMAFPADTPVAQGDTVLWTNRMNMNHTVTADNGEFDSGVLGKDKSFSHVFAAGNSVPYHCDIHPDMQGKVTVTAAPYTPEIGMRFWFEFDEATQGDDSFGTLIQQAGGFGVQNSYRTTRSQGTYPAAFLQQFQPRRDAWVKVAALQTDMIGKFLGENFNDIQAAFEEFGQGTLFDAQRPIGNQIHMMDGQTGAQMVGYHRWHASIRVIQLLGIGDNAWWENLNKVLGLAWAIQSFAKPKQQGSANPAVKRSDLKELRDAWLVLTPERRDRQYDLTAGPVGFHPSPKQPPA